MFLGHGAVKVWPAITQPGLRPRKPIAWQGSGYRPAPGLSEASGQHRVQASRQTKASLSIIAVGLDFLFLLIEAGRA